MHLYKYRWVYALTLSAIIMVLGFFYDLKSHGLQVLSLHQTEKRVKQKINRLQHSKQPKKVKLPSNSAFTLTQTKLFSHFSALADQYGLSLQSIDFLSHPFIPQMVKISLKGDFLHLSSFLLALSKQTPASLLLDFSYHSSGKNSLNLTFDAIVLNVEKNQVKNMFALNQASFFNPFCGQKKENVYENTSLRLLHWQSFTPIKQIKMVGYLQQGMRSQVLLSLPNHVVFAAKVGEKIGKESGVITHIQSGFVQVLGKKQEQWVLRI